MANTFAPFGLKRIGTTNASAPNFTLSRYRIASGDSAPVFHGDLVKPLSSGYVTAAAAQGANAPTTAVAGVFYGCEYFSTARQQKIRSRYWPGSDATGDVTAFLCDDPDAKFVVQGNSTTFNIGGTKATFTSSLIGSYGLVQMGTGSTVTGQSGTYLNASATAAAVTNTFIILDLVTDPPGVNGSDPTTAYNHVIVAFNAEALRGNSTTVALA